MAALILAYSQRPGDCDTIRVADGGHAAEGMVEDDAIEAVEDVTAVVFGSAAEDTREDATERDDGGKVEDAADDVGDVAELVREDAATRLVSELVKERESVTDGIDAATGATGAELVVEVAPDETVEAIEVETMIELVEGVEAATIVVVVIEDEAVEACTLAPF